MNMMPEKIPQASREQIEGAAQQKKPDSGNFIKRMIDRLRGNSAKETAVASKDEIDRFLEQGANEEVALQAELGGMVDKAVAIEGSVDTNQLKQKKQELSERAEQAYKTLIQKEQELQKQIADLLEGPGQESRMSASQAVEKLARVEAARQMTEAAWDKAGDDETKKAKYDRMGKLVQQKADLTTRLDKLTYGKTDELAPQINKRSKELLSSSEAWDKKTGKDNWSESFDTTSVAPSSIEFKKRVQLESKADDVERIQAQLDDEIAVLVAEDSLPSSANSNSPIEAFQEAYNFEERNINRAKDAGKEAPKKSIIAREGLGEIIRLKKELNALKAEENNSGVEAAPAPTEEVEQPSVVLGPDSGPVTDIRSRQKPKEAELDERSVKELTTLESELNTKLAELKEEQNNLVLQQKNIVEKIGLSEKKRTRISEEEKTTMKKMKAESVGLARKIDELDPQIDETEQQWVAVKTQLQRASTKAA